MKKGDLGEDSLFSCKFFFLCDPCVPFLLGSVPGSDVNASFHRNGIDSSNVNLKIFESSRVVGYPSCPIPPYSLTQ